MSRQRDFYSFSQVKTIKIKRKQSLWSWSRNLFSYLVLSFQNIFFFLKIFQNKSIHDFLLFLLLFFFSKWLYKNLITSTGRFIHIYVFQQCRKDKNGKAKRLENNKHMTALSFAAFLLWNITFLPDWLWQTLKHFRLIFVSFGTRRRIMKQELSRHRCH